jgi:hypothetical protein
VKKLLMGVAIATVVFAGALAVHAQDDSKNDDGPIRWTRNSAPTTTTIKGGPWTLEQSGAANGLKSAGYCDKAGVNQIGNPGTERMEPYYFPTIFGHGKHLQGYFDYRPKDTDEAVVAAKSDDGGLSWVFQQEILELRKTCPTDYQKDPDADKDVPPYADPNNADNVDDDGQGHQYVITISGTTYLYTLIRAVNHIDSDQLLYHIVTPTPDQPLMGAPTLTDAPTDSTSANPEPSFHTTGLLNPDGILGVVPGLSPLTIIYEQKVLSGDLAGKYALPASQQCQTAWGPYYTNVGISTNDDVTFLRLAQTTNGIDFTDLGPLTGLNDPTTVAINGTRWLATAGTILKLKDGRYGLFYSGGSCIDGDSDAFHYIGYAESNDLHHWHVVNGFDNPIVSVFPVTVPVDPTTGAYSTAVNATNELIPANEPVVGDTQGFFAGRTYAPSGAIAGKDDLTVIFAGYHTTKPKNGLGDYRTIGRVSLHSSQPLVFGDEDAHDNDGN